MSLHSNLTAEQRSTFPGVIAIMLWSTTIAFSRSLTEQLGSLTAATLIYILAGLIGILYAISRPGWAAALRKLSIRYLFGCGSLFIIYIVCLYLAIGSASTRAEVLAVGLINYLWPGLSLVFSIPILGNRSKALLPVGLTIALVGTWLAMSNADNLKISEFVLTSSSPIPYLLALIAAISWALYSNLSRKWAQGQDAGGVPLFLLASGLFLGIIRVFFLETTQWTAQTCIELIYMAVFPGMLAYVFWDVAIRKGKIILITTLSYLTPLLSTLTSAIVLKVAPGPSLWIGAILVFAGAVLCKVSVIEVEQS